MHLGLVEFLGQKRAPKRGPVTSVVLFRTLTYQILHVPIYPKPNSSGGIPYPGDPSIERIPASGPEV